MTTLIWDGKHVYTDSQVTADDMKGSMTKAVRVNTPDGPAVVAVCGEVDVLRPVVAAVRDGKAPDSHVTGNSTVLVVCNGAARVVSGKKSWQTDAPVFLGSGSGIARGAYYVSKSAAKAMQAACAIDLYSSGPVLKLKT